MNAVVAPVLPVTPIPPERLEQLSRAVEGLSPAQLYWVAAWTASIAQGQRGGPVVLPTAPAAEAVAADRLTIVYGSQTGNAKRIAEELAQRSESAGLTVRLLRADVYPQRELAKERYLVVVISTQGDGEPPDDARGLVEFIAGKRAPKLPGLKFAVLGLGDSSYPLFCAIGRQLDARFIELGATRFAPLAEADVDFETVSEPWLDSTLKQARELLATASPTVRPAALHTVPDASCYTRDKPFAATVLANQRIVSRDSDRDVRHIELSLEGSGLRYEPGDALGVWPKNPAPLVAQWLDALQLDGAREVTHRTRTLPLAAWLRDECEITRLSRPFVAALGAISGHAELTQLLHADGKAALAELLANEQPIDLLRRYPARWEPEALIAALRPLTPRLYSIASSRRAVDEEVHLTVAVVDYQAHGHPHWGAASTFLAQAGEDATVPVFIESNERFRLPADPARDVIMIGPGTGVAPFRAFVQERQETGASGRNWLFFGNRHFARDFLYQIEWQQALKDGALHRLDVAFSRDEGKKVYVQDRLRERGRDVYAWLEAGAHLYVCGDATRMAIDVQQTLLKIASREGGLDESGARQWLDDLAAQGRYTRDVY